jgi:hypothetical protein
VRVCKVVADVSNLAFAVIPLTNEPKEVYAVLKLARGAQWIIRFEETLDLRRSPELTRLRSSELTQR